MFSCCTIIPTLHFHNHHIQIAVHKLPAMKTRIHTSYNNQPCTTHSVAVHKCCTHSNLHIHTNNNSYMTKSIHSHSLTLNQSSSKPDPEPKPFVPNHSRV